jgi:hypothetical protein
VENILSIAYRNYNVVFLAVMTVWVTMSMSISMFMTLGTLMIGEEDGSYYSSELGRMSFIGVLSLSYQLNLTIFWKNIFCTLNSFSAVTLRGGNSCPWELLIIVRSFDFWALW